MLTDTLSLPVTTLLTLDIMSLRRGEDGLLETQETATEKYT